MAGMRPGICKLCRQQTSLAHSHILPEFFYKTVYDTNHRYLSVSPHFRGLSKPEQKGVREYMLCLSCEAKFGVYETYTATLLTQINSTTPSNSRNIIIPSFDYKKFKLFGLSILWRSHAALSPGCRSVNLGVNAKKIRKMLLSDNPGRFDEFGLVVAKIEGSKSADTIIMPPHKSKFGGSPAYFALAQGFWWVFIATPSLLLQSAHYPIVGLNSQLIVPVKYMSGDEFLEEQRQLLGPSLLKKLRQQGN